MNPIVLDKMAQNIVLHYVQAHHPEELSFFPSLWENISTSNIPPVQEHKGWRRLLKFLPIGLSFDREKLPPLDSVLVILLVKETLRNLGGSISVPTVEQLERCFRETALLVGASANDASNLASRLGTELISILNNIVNASSSSAISAASIVKETEPPQPNQAVAWLSVSEDIAPKAKNGMFDLLEESVRKNKDQYEIIIIGRTVNLKKDNAIKPLLMAESEYRLLVMFLKYRGKHLNTFELYRKAWSTKTLPHLHDEKSIVDNYLKTTISSLRDNFDSVKGFEIPRKRPATGYICMGNFKFAIVLTSTDDKLLTLHPS